MRGGRSSGSGPKAIRLFAAVRVPASACDAADSAIAPWRSQLPGARWVPRANWHVTISFLGWTSPTLVPSVLERLAGAAASAAPVETRVRGLGAFPTVHRARVLWAGLDDTGGGLAALAGTVRDALAREFPPEHRAFSAHLTLARSDPPLRLPEGFGETPLESGPFTIGELLLMRSHLRRPAPVYELVEEFPLGGT
ncbi:MAG: RNA 2',3'-cyclic phosphodiesterase [Actinomycetota bacterium]